MAALTPLSLLCLYLVFCKSVKKKGQGVAADNRRLNQLHQPCRTVKGVCCSPYETEPEQMLQNPLLAGCHSLEVLINNFQGRKEKDFYNDGLSSVILVKVDWKFHLTGEVMVRVMKAVT